MENQKSSTNDEFVASLNAGAAVADLWTTGQIFMDHEIAQYPVELVMWEKFLHARIDIKSIIELGSAAFGLSLYLALQAYQRGIEFRTFDNETNDNLNSPLGRLLNLKGKFILGDIFEDARPKLITLLEKELPHPLLLYCDNGDKPREFREFVPYLQAGDYVGVHDWGIEIEAKDVAGFDNLTPLYWDKWAEMGSITRFWRVK